MREFRVVKRWHGDVLANKGEPSSRFYIIHRQAPTTPPPLAVVAVALHCDISLRAGAAC